MTKLNLHVEHEEEAGTLRFPRVAQWEALARGGRTRRQKIPHAEAVKLVESAMLDAHKKFDHLRAMLGFPMHDDAPPPRAA